MAESLGFLRVSVRLGMFAILPIQKVSGRLSLWPLQPGLLNFHLSFFQHLAHQVGDPAAGRANRLEDRQHHLQERPGVFPFCSVMTSLGPPPMTVFPSMNKHEHKRLRVLRRGFCAWPTVTPLLKHHLKLTPQLVKLIWVYA